MRHEGFRDGRWRRTPKRKPSPGHRQRALRFHPDKNKEPGAEDTFKKVSEAYNILSDAAARRSYDAELRMTQATAMGSFFF